MFRKGLQIKRASALACGFIAFVLLASALIWPPFVAHLIPDRAMTSVVGFGLGITAFLLHDELVGGFVNGMNEFCRDVRRIADGDDDDDYF